MITKLRRMLRRKFDSLFYPNTIELARIGDACAWTIAHRILPESANVISGGVGHDISFEKALAQRYKCNVYLFDPSATGLETMSLQENRMERISFYPIGLAGRTGISVFGTPKDPIEGSFGIPTSRCSSTVDYRCLAMPDIYKQAGISRCDLLKLDIEGFEYEVLDSVLECALGIPQICVEFHHFLPGISIGKTLRTIRRLRTAGYRIAFKQQCDYLFVHSSWWRRAINGSHV